MVCGKFDPIHNGHIDHIIKASKLGDYLIIVTHIDETIARDSKKGECFVPLWARKLLLEGLLKALNVSGEVVVAEPIDVDGTISNTVRTLKPDILAKGGDRIIGNMPQNELDACAEVGCEVVYGIGDLLNSSSSIVRKGHE